MPQALSFIRASQLCSCLRRHATAPKTPHITQRRGLLSLAKLKNDELRALAFRTGINSSGTKNAITQRLSYELLTPRLSTDLSSAAHTRILSIDMGIRNLAFCVLDIPRNVLQPQHAESATMPAKIRLEAWRRTAVATAADPATDAKEAFDPSTYATLAYDLVTKTLLPHAPSHILIERQRYRSGGAHAVQEWTVRVNMFESMLHAVLRTLQREHTARGEGMFPEVHSVSPKKVARFYFADEGGTAEKETKGEGRKTGKVEKAMKVAVAELKLRDELDISSEAESISSAFISARAKANRRSVSSATRQPQTNEFEAALGSKTKPTRLTKLDDLADCLLQGLAWVQWEINRRAVLDQGYLKDPDLDKSRYYESLRV